MKKILLSLFAAIALNASAQTPTFESVQKFDCDNVLKIVRSTTDNAGNVYIGGYYTGTADFDPSTATNNQIATNYNSFIQKQTATGTILWTKFGTDINGLINYFDVDPTGNVYLLGYFVNVYDANFGSGTFNLTSNGGSDYFVTKLDSQGDFVWATSGGGANSENGEKIVVNQDGEAYIAVIETSTDVFAGSGSNSKDLKISKLNSSGTQIWASNFANYTGDFAYVNLELDQNNNPITSGRLRGLKDFDPTNGENLLGSSSAYTWDEFLVKLVNTTGAVSWANIINGASNSLISKKLAVDNQGNSYTYGRLGSGEVDFDVSANVANSVGVSASSGFIHKTTATGQHAWTITLSGFADYGHIEPDNQGNVYLLNDMTRNLTKYDNSGNNLWDFPYAATNAVDFEASSFNIDNLGSIYITGNGKATSTNLDTLSFNGSNSNGHITFTNTTNNSSEGFMVKFSQCLLSTATTISGSTLTATESGATYQWINCANNASIAGANGQTFTPSVSGSYAVIITNGSCADTSACQAVTISTSGIEEQTASNFNIYPNPAQDFVTLNNLTVGTTLQLTDMTGKTVLETSVLTEEMTIDLNGLMEGVYFVQILDNASIIGTKKLAISK